MNGSYKFLKSSYKVLVPYTISLWVHKLEMWNLVSHRILPLSLLANAGGAGTADLPATLWGPVHIRVGTHLPAKEADDHCPQWAGAECLHLPPWELGGQCLNGRGLSPERYDSFFSMFPLHQNFLCNPIQSGSDLLSRCSLCINFCDATFQWILFSVIIYVKVHSICWLH